MPDLPYPKRSGKVRDVYDLGGGRLLIVASDRISAFDVVLPTPVPGKGAILTSLSRFWFGRFAGEFPNHLLDGDLPPGAPAGRSTLCRRLDIVPFECVARGYLAGSGWREYRATGTVCGIKLPGGLRDGDRLPRPIFTPATKAVVGHDENVGFEVMADRLGGDVAEDLRDRTLRLYAKAAEYAEGRGILIADTKFEFGRDPATGEVLLADEALTPDSSRFWPADQWNPGGEGGGQPSFDKQYVREHLAALAWDRRPPGPALPPEVVAGTLARYREAHERLTGRSVP